MALVMTDDEDSKERLTRIEKLVTGMSTELESLREESRVASETMAAFSRSRAERSAGARRAMTAAKRRADERGSSTRKRTRKKSA
jgi:hypothetical protein